MTKLYEDIKEDTPRLWIKYHLIDGNDNYEWSLIPTIPLLSLIGGISRVIVELHASNGILREINRSPNQEFILTWDDNHKCFGWFIHQSIPVESLIGILENIKAMIIMSIQARRATAQQRITPTILGSDGRIIH